MHLHIPSVKVIFGSKLYHEAHVFLLASSPTIAQLRGESHESWWERFEGDGPRNDTRVQFGVFIPEHGCANRRLLELFEEELCNHVAQVHSDEKEVLEFAPLRHSDNLFVLIDATLIGKVRDPKSLTRAIAKKVKVALTTARQRWHALSDVEKFPIDNVGPRR